MLRSTLLPGILVALALGGAGRALAGPPLPPPAAPTDIGFDGVDTLTWTDNSDNEDGFRIVATINGDVFEYETGTDENVFALPAEAQVRCPGVSSAEYAVSAFNVAGESEPTTLAIAVDCPPGAPSNATVTGGVLSWTDNSDNENGFRITVRISGEVLIYEVGLNVTSFVLPAEARLRCPDRASVSYLVVAFNTFGESEPAGYAVAATCGVPGPTPSPTAAVGPTALPPAGGAGPGDGDGLWWPLAAVGTLGAAAVAWALRRRPGEW